MTARAALPDPKDLDALRDRLARGPGHERRPIGLDRVRIGPSVLDHLEDDVATLRGDGPVVVIVDETPMRRAGENLKELVQARLGRRFEARTAVIRTAGP